VVQLFYNYNDLKARVDAAEELCHPGPDCDLDFVQLGFGASILPSECTLELEASNGAKMKIGFKGAVDALALCEAFVNRTKPAKVTIDHSPVVGS
jgi:hypothetical protein